MKAFSNISLLCSLFYLTACQTVIVPHKSIQTKLNTNLQVSDNLLTGTLPAEMNILQAKEIALKNNPSLQAASQRIYQAIAIIDQARSLFQPTISATTGARHQHHSAQNIIGTRSPSYENYNASLNVQWLAFDGHAREFNLLAAEYGKVASQESYKDSQRILIDAVSQAFYQTILANKQMEINLELKQINEKFYKDTKIKLEAGTSTKTEMNNFIVNVNNSQIAYLDAKNTFETSKIVLLELLGSPSADINSFEPVYKNFKISTPDIKSITSTALNQRPDLKVLQANILATEAQIQQTKGEYYPKVYLEGKYGASSFNTAGFGDDSRDSYLGISMDWSLFTGHSTAAAISQKKAEKEETLKQLKAQWHEVISQIRQQRQSLINVLQRVKIQTESAALSKSIYEDTKEVYDNGATTITRVNEVLTDYSISRLSQVLYEVEAIRRKEILDSLMGINTK